MKYMGHLLNKLGYPTILSVNSDEGPMQVYKVQVTDLYHDLRKPANIHYKASFISKDGKTSQRFITNSNTRKINRVLKNTLLRGRTQNKGKHITYLLKLGELKSRYEGSPAILIIVSEVTKPECGTTADASENILYGGRVFI